jgi:hypothetical protein
MVRTRVTQQGCTMSRSKSKRKLLKLRHGRISRSMSAFRPRGSLDRRVNCRRVSQPRWVGARRNMKGGRDSKGKPAASVLSCAQVGCACSRGLQASARESEREVVRQPVLPRGQPSRTRALDLPFIDVRRGPRCTMGGVAVC